METLKIPRNIKTTIDCVSVKEGTISQLYDEGCNSISLMLEQYHKATRWALCLQEGVIVPIIWDHCSKLHVIDHDSDQCFVDLPKDVTDHVRDFFTQKS